MQEVLDPPAAPTVSFPATKQTLPSGAVWLDIEPVAGDPRPTFRAVPDAGWGLHLGDINIAWGQLSDLARRQSAAYLRRTAR